MKKEVKEYFTDAIDETIHECAEQFIDNFNEKTKSCGVNRLGKIPFQKLTYTLVSQDDDDVYAKTKRYLTFIYENKYRILTIPMVILVKPKKFGKSRLHSDLPGYVCFLVNYLPPCNIFKRDTERTAEGLTCNELEDDLRFWWRTWANIVSTDNGSKAENVINHAENLIKQTKCMVEKINQKNISIRWKNENI